MVLKKKVNVFKQAKKHASGNLIRLVIIFFSKSEQLVNALEKVLKKSIKRIQTPKDMNIFLVIIIFYLTAKTDLH